MLCLDNQVAWDNGNRIIHTSFHLEICSNSLINPFMQGLVAYLKLSILLDYGQIIQEAFVGYTIAIKFK